ncbi:hypothetical protein [Brevibacillus brevis]|uniref:hypothetical protein n=1 Tax=Brevibacillus brevis TaxID=1393 RepID=UPI000D109BC3|nr:hypothetical protein [Brevibacillus brevis]PSJ66239.1 hypothetical protein C7J99_26235 [Brevibacillus brevis]RED21742.1 hypothetical protein DES34_1187 [Brevibacillus brevis]GEC92492.1 hypothetical protein BBR01nite_48230 [Brevibacillus brevis]VEF92605.1 Uncharacterised protein [Brevibacillus brevis]
MPTSTTFVGYKATFHEGNIRFEKGLLEREDPKVIQAYIYHKMLKDVKKLKPKPNLVCLTSRGVQAEWVLPKPIMFQTQDEVDRCVDQINKGFKKNWFARYYSLDLIPMCNCH